MSMFTYVLVVTTDDDTAPNLLRRAADSIAEDITDGCNAYVEVVGLYAGDPTEIHADGRIVGHDAQYLYGTAVTA